MMELVELYGLDRREAEEAIRIYKGEIEAAKRRGYEQRKAREAFLRRLGYDEEYIRTH